MQNWPETITFTAAEGLKDRLDELAESCGMSRSQLLRMACALLDSTMTLSEIARLDAAEQMTAEAVQVEALAGATIARIGVALRPRGLPLTI